MMTLKELEAAWNAEADHYNQWPNLGLDEMIEFAQQQEREACAKICESRVPPDARHGTTEVEDESRACAEAIRMRFTSPL